MKNLLARFEKPSLFELFCLLGGLCLVWHYFWIMDDAFVYFRYIDNFLFLKAGLVYNQGEYVEGFSSPLWAVFLGLLRLTEVNYWAITLAVAWVSFGLFWYMLVLLNRILSPPDEIMNFLMPYLVFNYGVSSYFSSGLESPFVQLTAVAYALYILRPTGTVLCLVVALSPLVRHELAVPLLLTCLWTWRVQKKFPVRLVLMAAISLAAWMAFRIYYYADLFPSTFYLKDESSIGQGLVYLDNTVGTYHWLAVAVVMSILVMLLRAKRIDLHGKARIMMLVVAVSSAAYVVRIGGDARHYRYLAFSFCLACCAFGGILEHFIRNHVSRYARSTAIITGLALSLWTFSLYPPQLDKHPVRSDATKQDLDKISDAYLHRLRTWPTYSEWGKKICDEIVENSKTEGYQLEYRGVLARFWCATNYRSYDRRAIHSLGLTDPILARTVMKSDRPAHKGGLRPLAEDLAAIQRSSPSIGKGMYARAVKDGTAPPWIAKNLKSIEVIEQKMFNQHHVLENISLAFTFPERIQPGETQ